MIITTVRTVVITCSGPGTRCDPKTRSLEGNLYKGTRFNISLYTGTVMWFNLGSTSDQQVKQIEYISKVSLEKGHMYTLACKSAMASFCIKMSVQIAHSYGLCGPQEGNIDVSWGWRVQHLA
jgi:hypothetical protein